MNNSKTINSKLAGEERSPNVVNTQLNASPIIDDGRDVDQLFFRDSKLTCNILYGKAP